MQHSGTAVKHKPLARPSSGSALHVYDYRIDLRPIFSRSEHQITNLYQNDTRQTNAPSTVTAKRLGTNDTTTVHDTDFEIT